MMGHPYGIGWRAILTAERQRRRRRVYLTVAAVVAVALPIIERIGVGLGAW